MNNLGYTQYAGTRMLIQEKAIAEQIDKRGFSTGFARVFGLTKEEYNMQMFNYRNQYAYLGKDGICVPFAPGTIYIKF